MFLYIPTGLFENEIPAVKIEDLGHVPKENVSLTS